MDMRTDVNAVPHAGLGFHVLRVQVRKPKKEVEVLPAEVSKVSGGQQFQKKSIDRADDKVTTYVQKSQVQ